MTTESPVKPPLSSTQTIIPHKTSKPHSQNIRFSLNELSGGFGDLGTMAPLVIGMVLAGSASASGALIWFGIFSITAGLSFGIPLTVQPMKAIGALAITNNYSVELVVAAGLITGAFIFLTSKLRLLKTLQERTPLPLIIGIQLGLGLKLGLQAAKILLSRPLIGMDSLFLGILSIGFILVSYKWKTLPVALILFLVGVGFALLNAPHILEATTPSLKFPTISVPTSSDFFKGLNVAAAQIPLTIANSLLASAILAERLFPRRAPKIDAIATHVAAMSICAPLAGGIPMCHGAGGLAATHSFGARTGGSLVMLGSLFLLFGLLFENFAILLITAFPLCILGAMLLFVSGKLAARVRDLSNIQDMTVTAVTAILIVTIGMLPGLLGGIIAIYLTRMAWKILDRPHEISFKEGN